MRNVRKLFICVMFLSAAMLFCAVTVFVCGAFCREDRCSRLEAEMPANGGVGRETRISRDAEAVILLNGVSAEPTKQAGDIGCPDWNLNTSLVGWEGRTMEVWEMDLFSRIFYLEFWQPNLTLCEAGCDAILQLWKLNGGTMYETLSAVTESGAYSFSTYPAVWESEYDAEGLAWCRAYCEERFSEGPVWAAQYFRKGQFHDWGEWSPIPAYVIGNIYFSIARWQ